MEENMSRFIGFLVRWGELTFESSRENIMKRYNLEEIRLEDLTSTDQGKSSKKNN
jgi:hypothetical protein